MPERSFFGDSVIEALAEARQVMGEDSFLVEARRASRGSAGAFEVVVRSDEDGRPREHPHPGTVATPAAGPEKVNSELVRLSEEIARLRQWIYEARQSGPPVPRWMQPWRARMVEQGTPLDLVDLLMDGVYSEEAESANSCTAAWQRLLNDFVAPEGEPYQGGRVAFVGPPGAGKTTLAVKVAVRMGIEQRRSVAFLAFDGWRAAGHQVLRTLAGLIGAPFALVEEPALLPAALREFAGKDMILIDTPGLSPAEIPEAGSWAEALLRVDGLQRHLVLAATNRLADLEKAVDCWSVFRPRRLAFTRLDETSAPGVVPGLAAMCRLPVSFLAFGTGIPEDFDQASSGLLLGMVVGREARETARAARMVS